MRQPSPIGEALRFGPFRLHRADRLLFDGDKPVRLGSRAMDLLIGLVERAGEVVSKTELTALAWPDSAVEESNLRVHIAAIRKMLGDGLAGVQYIQSVSGRGYRFIVPVSRSRSASADAFAPFARSSELPAPLTRIVGRETILEALALQVSARRLVTIAGPGGVGKSTIALAVAGKLADNFDGGAFFVELSAIADPEAVPATLATILGISIPTDDPIPSLIGHLNSAPFLIVLDNCEHVIAAAAQLVEAVLRLAPNTHILATSREPLAVTGEHVHRLTPLAAPRTGLGTLNAAQALSYPAVQLFVERAASSLETFRLNDDNAGTIVEICRRLDGMPLAIELAAARVDNFGIDGLAKRLDDHLLLVAEGRERTELRHQSLRATLDWSVETLSRTEQTVLRRLAVIRGPLTLATAIAIAAFEATSEASVTDAVASLARKSLLTTDVSSLIVRHRLLHITRVYALEKLAEHGELQNVLRRHAEHYQALLTSAEADWESMARAEWLVAYGYMIEDVRAAQGWAYSAEGDAGIGAALTCASLPFGFQLSLLDETRGRTMQALAGLATVSPPQLLLESRLNEMLGSLICHMSGDQVAARAVLTKAISLAERLETPKYLFGPLVNHAVAELDAGNNPLAVSIADRLSSVARTADDPLGILLADGLSAQACHFAGDHQRARRLAERVINHPAKSLPLVYCQTSMDRQVSMRVILARLSWLEGDPDQAWSLLDECLALARRGSPYELCHVLGVAGCPIALWMGADDLARELTARLLDSARRYTLSRWGECGLALQQVLEFRQRRSRDSTSFCEGLQRFGQLTRLQREMLATVCEAAVAPDMVERAKTGEAGWCAPEILRAAGEMLLREGGSGTAAKADALFRHSQQIARDQGALAWELRAAISIARLQQKQGSSAEAEQDLAMIINRFTEGRETADLKEAKNLLRSFDAVHPPAGR